MRLRAINAEQVRVLDARIAKVAVRREALRLSRATLRKNLSDELTRPGSLAAVACAGFLFADTRSTNGSNNGSNNKSAQAGALDSETIEELAETLKYAAESGALQGGELGALKGAEKTSESADDDDSSGTNPLNYLFAMATTAATKFAMNMAIEQLQFLRETHFAGSADEAGSADAAAPESEQESAYDDANESSPTDVPDPNA